MKINPYGVVLKHIICIFTYAKAHNINALVYLSSNKCAESNIYILTYSVILSA
jgi:hypothetical protein